MSVKEQTILQELLNSPEFISTAIPFIKEEYFELRHNRKLFKFISAYFSKFDKAPTVQQIAVWSEDITGLNEDEYQDLRTQLNTLNQEYSSKYEWAIEMAQTWCQERGKMLAFLEAIEHTQADSKPSTSLQACLDKIAEASGIRFLSDIGHDIAADSDDYIESMLRKDKRIPTSVAVFDEILGGGFPIKTLSCFLASTNVGKTALMCALTANMLRAGYKVLYVSLEMSKYEIESRVHASLSKRPLNLINEANKEDLEEVVNRSIHSIASGGRLMTEEFPTASVDTSALKALLVQLKQQRDFVPDVVFVDYLNLFNSSRVNNNSGSYTIVKSIAEELRGIAVANQVPIITATQSNRAGYNNSDMDLTNTSESIGLPATVDFMASLTRDDNLDAMDQILVKQQKNRFRNKADKTRFAIGFKFATMSIYDLDDPTESLIDEKSDEQDAVFKTKFAEFSF